MAKSARDDKYSDAFVCAHVNIQSSYSLDQEFITYMYDIYTLLIYIYRLIDF